MRKYKVTIALVVNPSRDLDLDTPETVQVEFIVEANSENEARDIAKEMPHKADKLSVWESWAEELEAD